MKTRSKIGWPLISKLVLFYDLKKNRGNLVMNGSCVCSDINVNLDDARDMDIS